jgi:hypothetical protein
LQLRVFCFGRDENGDVRVGVFPERKKILICGSGLGCIAREVVGASEAKVGEGGYGLVDYDAGPIEDFLKLRRSAGSLTRSKESLATDIDRIEVGPEGAAAGNAEFVGSSGGEGVHSLRCVVGKSKCELCAKSWQVIELHDGVLGKAILQIIGESLRAWRIADQGKGKSGDKLGVATV